jgi:hypothetical protein
MTAALLALSGIVAGIAMLSVIVWESAPAAPEKSIAVLPFGNLSRDPTTLTLRRHPGRNPDAFIQDR